MDYIGDEGAKVIDEAFRISTTLIKLNEYMDNIDNEGAKAIGKGIKTNSYNHLCYLFFYSFILCT